jgi:Fic family protein
LLATVVGFHGLGDGNGRTGRALYAISQLRNNRFTPLTKQEFSLLHGLD